MAVKPEGGFMTVTGHLSELRTRIIRGVLALSLGFGVCYFFQDYIFSLLLVHSEGLQLITVSPAELFMEGLKTSFLSGLFISSPVILYQLCAFLWPGLKDNERKYLFRGLIIGSGLFILGVIFAYCVIIPAALGFLSGLTISGVKPMYTLNNYMSFVWTFLILFGLSFQVPVLIFLLALIGIVRPESLRSKRKFCVILIFVVAALLTPPDVVSQVLMALPLLALYEIGIIGAGVAVRMRGQ